MRTSINSKVLGKNLSFWMRDAGGYVYLEDKGPGTTGSQICQGGGFMGNTLSATSDSFEKICRSWYRSHIRNQQF